MSHLNRISSELRFLLFEVFYLEVSCSNFLFQIFYAFFTVIELFLEQLVFFEELIRTVDFVFGLEKPFVVVVGNYLLDSLVVVVIIVGFIDFKVHDPTWVNI